MSFPSDQRFGPDTPFGPSTRPSSGVWIVVAIVGLIGLLACVILFGVAVSVWQPFRVERLPPREAELADQGLRHALDGMRGAPAAGEQQELNELRRVFNSLRRAFREADAEQVEALLDGHRAYQELARVDAVQGLNIFEERQYISEFQESLAANMVSTAEAYAYDRFQIQRFRLSKPAGEALLYVRHFDDSGYEAPYLWWLYNRNGRWRIFDFEQIDEAIRLSDLVAANQNAEESVDAIREAAGSIGRGNPYQAETMLEKLDETNLSEPLQAAYWFTWARVHNALGRHQPALECCDRAQNFRPEMIQVPHVRAAALHGLKCDSEAESVMREHLRMWGGDPGSYLLLADALEGQGQTEAVLDVHRKSLAENPNAIFHLLHISRLLGAGNKQEIAERFLKLPRSGQRFEELCEMFLDGDDREGVEVLIGAYRPLAGDDPDVPYYRARLKFLAEDYAGVGEILKEVLPRLEGREDREVFIDLYLDAMVAAGTPLAGYAGIPDKPYAFEYLSDELLKAGGKLTQLEQLIATHATDHADDPWLNYYRGEVELGGENWDDAARLYFAGWQTVTDESIRWAYWSRAVESLYRAGRGLDAYTTITPARGVFEQLAEHADEVGDARFLRSLIAAHRQADPADEGLPLWEAEVSWLLQDYAAAVEELRQEQQRLLAEQSTQEATDEATSVIPWSLDQRLVVSLIRLNRLDEAQAAADDAWRRNENAWLPAYVQAARGDATQTIEWLSKLVEQGYETEDIYNDDVLAPLLQSDGLRRVRERFAPPKRETLGDAKPRA